MTLVLRRKIDNGMTLVLKRKVENMSEDLNFGCDEIPVKRSRNSSDETKECSAKLVQMIKLLMSHIFSTPFLKGDECEKDDENPKYFDDVLEKVQKNKFYNLGQVFDDLEKILANTEVDTKQGYHLGKNYSHEDVQIMANEIRKKINKVKESLFNEESYFDTIQEKKSLTNAKQQSDLEITFQTLKSRYSAVPEVTLMAKALEITTCESFDIEEIEHELDEVNKKHQKKFKPYKFVPSRDHEFDKDKVIHSYIAGYQFHKMISKSSNAPVPLRTILNTSDAIESITYIENNESTAAYEKQKALFKEQGKLNKDGKVDELLLFHGTAVSSIDSILSTNFVVDSLPQQRNSQNEQRKKTMMFGRGIYFSELPAVSLMYGNGLLLCKVLPGNTELFQPQGVAPGDIPEEYDAREVQATASDSQGIIHVIKTPAQILPYCVIQLKKQSLTSEYRKPSQCVQTKTPVKVVNQSASSPPNFTSCNTQVKDNTWNMVTADQASESRWTQAEKTIRMFTVPTSLFDDKQSCSICCDPLSSAESVSLAICGHKFHSSCIQQLISHQAGQQHIQCPLCQTIHGVKTGNQPAGGKMMFRKHSAPLPGYQGCGMIVIKYIMESGVQEDIHPNPGKPFHAKGFPRTAFLPDNEKGNRVLQLLVKAFQRRLIFTVGSSLSRGEDDCVTWNGIHHKTQLQDIGNGHGYPDFCYLDRVIEELKQKGVE